MSYQNEQQQIDKLKNWWNENGTSVIVGAVLGLGGFFGWKYWDERNLNQQQVASDLYNQVIELSEEDDKTKFVAAAKNLKEKFPESTYAIFAAFHLAKQAVDKKELQQAETQLQWVIKNHADNELVDVAKIRLARLFVQQEKFQQALELTDLNEESGYYTLASMIKGNALAALGKNEDALTAYQQVASDREIAGLHPSLQYKIDKLSSEVAPPPVDNENNQVQQDKQDDKQAAALSKTADGSQSTDKPEQAQVKQEPAVQEQETTGEK